MTLARSSSAIVDDAGLIPTTALLFTRTNMAELEAKPWSSGFRLEFNFEKQTERFGPFSERRPSDGHNASEWLCRLAKGAAFAALLVTGCASKESRGFAATSLRQLRARLERHIEPGFAPGMVGLVASGPEVETFVLGKMAFEGPDRAPNAVAFSRVTYPVTHHNYHPDRGSK